MNSSGIFSFLLLVGFIAIQAAAIESNRGVAESRAEAGQIAIEIEQLSLARAQLDLGVDRIIEETIKDRANSSPGEIKARINSRLLGLFSESAKGKKAHIKFYAGNNAALSEEFLNKNSNVLLLETRQGRIVQYNFHGGVLKRNNVMAEIRSKHSMMVFRLPAGYSRKKLVVG